MEAITIKQFSDWLEKNKHRTWYLGKGGGWDTASKKFTGMPEFKYFDISFNTRDWKIYKISIRGSTDLIVHCMNEYRDLPGNLLDLLESKLDGGKNVQNKNKKKSKKSS